jgi:nitronate monooxygenase
VRASDHAGMDTNLSRTRFCQRFQLDVPIALAPMAYAAGGLLAAACARAGALGLVGGGYCELPWLQREYPIALEHGSPERIDRDASPLDWVLERRPRALMLSFGDPRPYGPRITASGASLVCQVQRLDQVPQALEAGAEVIVAQGTEGGGHSIDPVQGRSTLTLVPEMADWLAAHSPQTLLLAAGGVADGRTLAAALVLGADGALVGSRLWATRESLAAPAAKQHALGLGGDDTIRTPIFDALAGKAWPETFGYTRASRNALHRQWEGRYEDLRAAPAPARAEHDAGAKAGDYSRAFIAVGEAVGLIEDVPPAGELLARMAGEAKRLLGQP